MFLALAGEPTLGTVDIAKASFEGSRQRRSCASRRPVPTARMPGTAGRPRPRLLSKKAAADADMICRLFMTLSCPATLNPVPNGAV
jgi:hypothetical protein